jgi:hypothetical protein
MLRRSLVVHADAVSTEVERRIALAGDVTRYANHGLLADLEAQSRAWTQRHVPEVHAYLRRHIQFVDQQFASAFGAAGLMRGRLRISQPTTSSLPVFDGSDRIKRQRSVEAKRYIVPGVLSILGGMIALPVGVVGLYAGMQLASQLREAEAASQRLELQAMMLHLVNLDTRRLEEAIHALLKVYFDDLDQQLSTSFKVLVEENASRLNRALALRQEGEDVLAERRERIERALRLVRGLRVASP